MGDRRNDIDEVFGAALPRPPEERAALPASTCDDGPIVKDLVERLLAVDQRAASLLRDPTVDPSYADVTVAVPAAEPLVLQPTFDGIRSGFRIGAIIASRFRINRFIAGGGMGEVYEAWDLELKERVALKTIRPDLAGNPRVLERFRREVKQARAISHPNVCRVHELFCEEVTPDAKVWFLSMEYLEGFPLSESIRHNGRLQPGVALSLLEQIISGLKAAHRLGVVHRDLKTGNIMLVNAGPGELRAVITDFGLAINVLYADRVLAEPGGQGTPAFMAPEQRHTGEVTWLADQYALGVIASEMLTGSRPVWSEHDNDKADRGRPTLAAPVDARWSKVIHRCLAYRPEDRFASLDQILAVLRPAESSAKSWAWAAAVAALLIAAALSYREFTRHAAPPTSLAVLPLQNQTGDPNLEYLGAGITEALTNDLAQMPGLQVAAATVARRFRGPDVDPTAAGKGMHVVSLVSGSVEDGGGKLRVPIELVDANTGRQMWGQTYESAYPDVAGLQHQVSTDVAYHLQIRLSADATARLKRQYSTNASTYDAYLKGRYQLARRSPDALREAVTDFQRALVSDPKYAPAYAGLADCYSLLAFYGLEKARPLLENAMQDSQEALRLDSTLGEAYTSRALARTLLNFDWAGAEEDYKRSIALNPTYLQAHTWYALLLLLPQSRQAEARAQLAYVRAMDPDAPMTLVGFGMLDYFSGHSQELIHTLLPRASSGTSFEPLIEVLAEGYLDRNSTRQALQLLQTAPADADAAVSRQALLAVTYAKAGQQDRATEALQTLLRSVGKGAPLHYEAAVAYTALGDHQHALKMLDLAFAEREPEVVFLNVTPLLAALHGEREFVSLVGQMKLQ